MEHDLLLHPPMALINPSREKERKRESEKERIPFSKSREIRWAAPVHGWQRLLLSISRLHRRSRVSSMASPPPSSAAPLVPNQNPAPSSMIHSKPLGLIRSTLGFVFLIQCACFFYLLLLILMFGHGFFFSLFFLSLLLLIGGEGGVLWADWEVDGDQWGE